MFRTGEKIMLIEFYMKMSNLLYRLIILQLMSRIDNTLKIKSMMTLIDEAWRH